MIEPPSELSASDLSRLAVFPLANTVLFPGAVLPLHIFEPRYREMTRDAIAGRRYLAIARLRPGFEESYQGRPPIFEICGLGFIVEDRCRTDGRYDIVVRGLARVRLVQELPPSLSYRLFSAERLLDAPVVDRGSLGALQQKLSTLWERLRPHLPAAAKDLGALTAGAKTPGEKADRIAEALVADPEERQALLEELDPEERFSRLVTRLDEVVCALVPDRTRGDYELN